AVFAARLSIMGLTGKRLRARKTPGVAVSVVMIAVLAIGTPMAAQADETGPSAHNAQQYEQARAKAAAASGMTTAPDKAPSRTFRSLDSIDKSAFAVGDLMSDAVFFNGSFMDQSAVQTFLNGQVPTCRAGYICLKSYTTSTVARPADAMCSGYSAVPGETAAAIIAKVGQSCGISQGVILALLQKEQGLVTDDWPSATQYQFATGYNCPDTPGVGCASDTSGFFQQVYGAAWQFKRYGNPAGTSKYFTWYPVGKVTQVSFSQDASCGTAPVAIWNKSTAALYYYTPYQPDAAALANFFGSGDACSSYGNRNFWGSYNQWFGSSAAGSTPPVTRASGADRFDTAVLVSKAAYPSGNVPYVSVASGLDFPDALGAAPAAAKDGGPLLLVMPDSIPAGVVAEIQRLNPQHIRVVGGPGAISDAVYTQLAGLTPNIARYSGADRYESSRNLVSSEWTSASQVFLATGANFPDALSAGAAAGSLGMPVILVDGSADTLDAPTAQLISNLGAAQVTIVGGLGAVSSGIQQAVSSVSGVKTVVRFSGSDRFEVSTSLNAAYFPNPPAVYFANGLTFPDALAGAAAAAAAHSPLYVARPGCVAAPAAEAALSPSSAAIRLLGGLGSLSAEVGKLTVC
ncbi:MAG: cell wall-binding repeat-containing protein, partial [Leifsonia sp.]